MATTVLEVITDAFYTSTIVSREFQQVDPYQYEDGINLLNEIITDKTIEQDMIPSYSVIHEFHAVRGQEKYFIPHLTRLDVLTFFIQKIRYPMKEMNRDEYFGAARANDILSLPFAWHQERVLDGTNIYMYFYPEQNYLMQASGLFSIPIVSFNQDLDKQFDPFFISYLKYRLADKLCTRYNLMLPPGATKELARYERMISKRSGVIDLKSKMVSTLQDGGAINYAQINIGKGFTAV